MRNGRCRTGGRHVAMTFAGESLSIERRIRMLQPGELPFSSGLINSARDS